MDFVRQSIQYVASSSIYFPQLRHVAECFVQQFVFPDEAIVLSHPACAQIVCGVPNLFVKCTVSDEFPANAAVSDSVAAASVATGWVNSVVCCAASPFVDPHPDSIATSPNTKKTNLKFFTKISFFLLKPFSVLFSLNYIYLPYKVYHLHCLLISE